MTNLQMMVAVTVALSFIGVTSHEGVAASATCNKELRKCNSHCNLVYESSRARRVCRDRCKDTFYACKARSS